MNKKNPKIYKLLWVLIAVVAGFITEGLCLITERTVAFGEFARNIMSYISIWRIIFFEVLYLGTLLTIDICNKREIDLLDKIYKYRYIVAGVALLICIIFKINGSSIGCWDGVTGYSNDKGMLSGISRAIRSDEWAVSTPMAIAQEANNYKYFSSNLRGGLKTDMFIVYGQPVRDISIIFRLFHIGYILFGSEVRFIFLLVCKVFSTTFGIF